MASVAASPAVRHGTTRLVVLINGESYVLRRMPPPPGFAEVWVLKRSRPDSAGECPRYCVASHAEDPEPGCTCPDHRRHGTQCKHIRALVAHGLIARPVAEVPLSPAPPVAAPSFAEGFRQAVSDHLAARRPAAAPAPAPSPALVESPAKARRAHAPRAREALAAAPAPAPSPRIVEEGWQPGGMAGIESPEARAERAARIGRGASKIAAREDARHHARPRRKPAAAVTTS